MLTDDGIGFSQCNRICYRYGAINAIRISGRNPTSLVLPVNLSTSSLQQREKQHDGHHVDGALLPSVVNTTNIEVLHC
jgi:hypothetical protein